MTEVSRIPDAKGAGGALSGLRVLFLPKNSRSSYFASFLAAAQETCGWRIHVVCPQSANAFWAKSIGGPLTFSGAPDFVQTAPWENDASAAAELDQYIARAERFSDISAGRIVLAGERDLGRGFSRPVYNWFHNSIARTVLADNTQPFPIVRRMFAFARDTLEAVQPQMVLAGEWADPLCFTFLLAAREGGVPCIVNRPSKIWSGRSYWSNEPSMYNHRTREVFKQKQKQKAAVSSRARQRISEFRERPETLGYVQKNWESADRTGWLAGHARLARLLGVQLALALGRRNGPPPKPALQIALEHYRQPWLKWRQRRFFSTLGNSQLRDLNYVFLAFHKDPEQALNYQAPFWVNQHNTAALLSGSLPAGYKLLVREHRLNAGRRPSAFYKELLRLPQLVLIDAFDDQFKYIANADLVVTDNGSTGWEGLVLGRRVLSLAENFYEAAGLARRVRAPGQLAQEIIDILGRPAVADADAHDRALGWLLDAEWETTAPIEQEGHDRTLKLLARSLHGDSAAPETAERVTA